MRPHLIGVVLAWSLVDAGGVAAQTPFVTAPQPGRVAAGFGTTYAADPGGRLWAWGSDQFGILGVDPAGATTTAGSSA